MSDADTLRKNVASLAIKLFSKKGGPNLKSLNGNDIRAIFKIYDEIFFNNQIQNKAKSKALTLDFEATNRKKLPGGRIIVNDDSSSIIFDIAPNMLDTIANSSPNKMKNRLACLQHIIEHQIIHLLMILWDIKKRYGNDAAIFGSHGALFQCMAKEYFGHTRFDHDLGINEIVISPSSRRVLVGDLSKRRVLPQGAQRVLPQGAQRVLPQGAQRVLPQGAQRVLPQGAQRVLPQGAQRVLPQGAQRVLPQGAKNSEKICRLYELV